MNEIEPPDRPAKSPSNQTVAEAPVWWLQFVEDILDEGLEREEQFDIAVEDLTLDVPVHFGTDASFARWGFDGRVSVRIEGTRGPLAEWLQFWASQRTDD